MMKALSNVLHKFNPGFRWKLDSVAVMESTAMKNERHEDG